ncbi:hypoxanthine phosphoribosyltransferase [Bernardetia litoralis DSM 6794]|uniref:Hypoxanthine phosphoribosyltransferase n=1 Tax=Bernardetia litoralis (strain ATCC 23117 / DSM 6794 / NBRC 15988 / NCIMB 1366 / Fx l1 / Sio-4) TaxID=880071 RepID=I4AFW8_BERLS|nr:hypoxanthine phosphoribosyltransferase [Bernardetia litoralis]AFM02853.1 hypoxanthine phosphoribosyltransferase [Bernardetia litoralis DSM 6794]
MKPITSRLLIQDKYFKPYLSEDQMYQRVQELGKQIEIDYEGKKPLLLCILNGSFVFAADLVRAMDTACQISFLKYSSYVKDKISDNAKDLLGIQGLNESLENRHLIVVEDIVDTGNTMNKFLKELSAYKPASIEIATCLFKPSALKFDISPKYVAFSIPNDFVVGYGLDYDNYGRNLRGIYVIDEDENNNK